MSLPTAEFHCTDICRGGGAGPWGRADAGAELSNTVAASHLQVPYRHMWPMATALGYSMRAQRDIRDCPVLLQMRLEGRRPISSPSSATTCMLPLLIN